MSLSKGSGYAALKLCHYAMPDVVCKAVDASFFAVGAGWFFCF